MSTTTTPTHDDHLRAFLADRDYGCPVCRYNLRGVRGASCPECGARLELQVGSIDLRLGPWLMALLSAALPFGFNALMGAIGSVITINDGNFSGHNGQVLAILGTSATITGATVAVLCWKRRRFLRLLGSRQWQWAVLIAVTLGTLVAAEVWQLSRL